MKTGAVLLLLFLVGFHPTLPAAGQIMVETKPLGQLLKQWADRETVEKWTQAIREGQRALAGDRLADAETFFRQAILACDRNASEDIHQCIGRLLLAEVFLEAGKTAEAKVQVDQLAASLKKATRYKVFGKSEDFEAKFTERIANVYRYQVGGALYVRAARIYLRLGTPRSAEPLFPNAIRIFGQPTQKGVFAVLEGDVMGFTEGKSPYPLRHLRIAEIHEAHGRFHLLQGRDDQAVKSLREAEKARKNPRVDSKDRPITEVEVFRDQLVAEPLDKSFLKRFLEDCAFYRFDDARIADLLDRQAALLKKVGRTDEATAFERFAESLRKKPLNPQGLSHLGGGPIFD